VETLRLQTLSVLFFIEIGTRRIHLAGCTAKPSAASRDATGSSTGVETAGGRACDAVPLA
jgi:hypothetical protein